MKWGEIDIGKKQRISFFGVLLALMVLTHFKSFQRPPQNVHAWRQCNTLSVARNFAEEDMNIFRPRVDRRLDTDGVTGMQFPSYEFGLALLYKLFGESLILSRIYSLLIVFMASIAMFYIGSNFFNTNLIAILLAYTLVWSPDLFYHSVNALPDILALCFSIWAFAFYLKWEKIRKNTFFAASMFCLLLGGLTKLQFGHVAVPIFLHLLYLVRNGQLDKKYFRKFFAFGTAVIGTIFLWYLYAINLRERSGLHDFGIHFNPVKKFSEVLPIIFGNVSSDIPELLLNFSSFLVLIVGTAVFIIHQFKSIWLKIGMVWTIILTAYHFIELGQMKDHGYYMMPYLLPAMLLIGKGYEWLLNKNWNVLVIIVLLAQPVLAYTRMSHRWQQPDAYIPKALYEFDSRAIIQNLPKDGLAIVGPDISGSIMFYYTKAKGFGFNQSEELFETHEGKFILQDYLDRGAKYLYTPDINLLKDDRFTAHVDSICYESADYVVVRLK